MHKFSIVHDNTKRSVVWASKVQKQALTIGVVSFLSRFTSHTQGKVT